jgi:signal peptidase I
MSEPKIIKGAAGAAPAVTEESWWETVKVIVQALVIALVVRTLLFQPFNIPSGSLIPTLLIGDYLFVSKYAYGYSHYSLPSLLDLAPQAMPGRLFFSPPKRGDIIVFRPPGEPDEDFIKRLIGLPGDKIQMIRDRLYINGVVVPREPAPPYDLGEDSRGQPVLRYYETLPDSAGHPGGVRHEIIQIAGDEGQLANTPVFEVPPGHYFMMGDNRDNSEDSRAVPGPVGYVPEENLIGRAEIIFFSVAGGEPAWEVWRWPWTVRWNRLFQRIH